MLSWIDMQKNCWHALLQERHLVDVVQALPALRLPLPRLLEHLRQLQPRLYSISSSQLENPARVQVSVPRST